MPSKVYTVEVVVDPNDPNELVLPIPSELMQTMGWQVDDTLEWVDNMDGTFSLTKVDDPILGDVVYGEGC